MHPHPRSLLSALVLSALACGCERQKPADLVPQTSRLNVSSYRVEFGHVDDFAEPLTKEVRLYSAGTVPLKIQALTLEAEEQEETGFSFSFAGSFADKQPPFEVPPRQSLRVQVRFAPQQTGEVTRLLRVQTDAPQNGQPVIHLHAVVEGGNRGVTCPASTECVRWRFDPRRGTCERKLLHGSCSDGLACTVHDRCKEGVCVGKPKNCPPNTCFPPDCS